MPKKKTKIKTKTEKVKAVAKTKKGGAQAQVQNVVVKIGETKKRPRRRAPPKKKSEGTGKPTTFPPSGDGWFPPQNLMRNGATFGSAEQIRYVNVPTPAQTSFVAGGAVQPPTFVPPAEPVMPEEPDMQSGYDASFAPEADSGINMTEFLRQWKQPRERQSYILSEEEEKSFAPPIPESPTFAEPVEEQPTLVEPSPIRKKKPEFIIEDDETELLTPLKKTGEKIQLVNEISGILKTLEQGGIVPIRGQKKQDLIKELFGSEWVKGRGVKDYNIYQLNLARNVLRNNYGL